MKLKTSLFSELSGSVAQAFQGEYPTCRTRRDGAIILQRKPIPSYGRTPAQDAQRVSFSDAVDAWNSLSQEEKEGWNVAARPYFITGYNYYLKIQLGTKILICPDTADTYVNQWTPNSNYGSEESFVVGNYTDQEQRALLKFDLGSIPALANILTANIYIWYDNEGGEEEPSEQIDVYRITSAWAELTVTWNTKPSIAGEPSTSYTLGTQGSWRSFNVAADIQGFIDNSYTNHGHLLRFNTAQTEHEYYPLYWAREHLVRKPYLRVEYI